MNIMRNKYDVEELQSFEAKHLIINMIKGNPKERYTISEVLKHPFFWDDFKKLNFLQEFSDYIESNGKFQNKQSS